MSVEVQDSLLKREYTEYEFSYPTTSPGDGESSVVAGPREEAGLRQFDFTRLMAYGIEPGDATRFIEALKEGAHWEEAAREMESSLSDRQSIWQSREMLSPALTKEFLERRSALLRISQAMEVRNTARKRETYLEAARLYSEAKSFDPRYSSEQISTPVGTLHAWQIVADSSTSRGTVLVHGGVDGWSMDWDGLATEVASEGFNVIVLDGPGQGESRFVYGTYLTEFWSDAYGPVIEHMKGLDPELPLFAVGNSMAAGIVLQLQNRFRAFSGVCSNGPVASMSGLFTGKTYGLKLASFCGDGEDVAHAQTVFRTVDLKSERVEQDTPVLLLQGTADPMVPVADGKQVLEWTRSPRQSFAIFERGEHVLNRFPSDKHMLLRAWLNSLT